MQWAGPCANEDEGCPNPALSSGLCEECKTAALTAKPRRRRDDGDANRAS